MKNTAKYLGAPENSYSNPEISIMVKDSTKTISALRFYTTLKIMSVYVKILIVK